MVTVNIYLLKMKQLVEAGGVTSYYHPLKLFWPIFVSVVSSCLFYFMSVLVVSIMTYSEQSEPI